MLDSLATRRKYGNENAVMCGILNAKMMMRGSPKSPDDFRTELHNLDVNTPGLPLPGFLPCNLLREHSTTDYFYLHSSIPGLGC